MLVCALKPGTGRAADDMDEMVSAVKHAIMQCCHTGELRFQHKALFCLRVQSQVFMTSCVRCSFAIQRSGLGKPVVRLCCSLVLRESVVCVQLRVKIAKQQAAKEQKLRKKNLTKYIPNAAYAIYRVLQSMSETEPVLMLHRRTLSYPRPMQLMLETPRGGL